MSTLRFRDFLFMLFGLIFSLILDCVSSFRKKLDKNRRRRKCGNIY